MLRVLVDTERHRGALSLRVLAGEQFSELGILGSRRKGCFGADNRHLGKEGARREVELPR